VFLILSKSQAFDQNYGVFIADDILQGRHGMFPFRMGGRLHDCSSRSFTDSYVQVGQIEFLASSMIPLNLGRRIAVVPLISRRPIVNNNKNNNKVENYPIAGFFRLVDGFVDVVVVFD
jgi:hypothetical protein